jgi:hypothetical protein
VVLKIRPGYFIGSAAKRLSRERLERAGTEAPTRKKLADINDTDEPRTEDWGRQREIIKKE